MGHVDVLRRLYGSVWVLPIAVPCACKKCWSLKSKPLRVRLISKRVRVCLSDLRESGYCMNMSVSLYALEFVLMLVYKLSVHGE